MSSEVESQMCALIPGRLRLIAQSIDKEAQLSARPGQLDRLEELAIAVRQIAHELDGGGHHADLLWPGVPVPSELRGEGKDGDG